MAKARTSGVTIYIQEELSDARLRCDELKHMVVRAIDLVNASKHRDHLYGVAGDMLHSVPETMIKLERALQAAALAVNELDDQDIRQILRPEKIDELEVVLDEIRIKVPKRTGADSKIAATDGIECPECGDIVDRLYDTGFGELCFKCMYEHEIED